MSIKINNRRYLGNKYKLLSFIKGVIEEECKDVSVIFDVFAGTGVVSSAFLDRTVIVNDILKSNHFCHLTWFSPLPYSEQKIEKIINFYNGLSTIKSENYMSENFADTFFSYNVCKKIGYIREDIEEKYKSNEINKRERAILITSLLYAMDKIANTCGHYDAYIRNKDLADSFIMEVPEISKNLSKGNKCFNMDSKELAKKIQCDLAYLDPPYNSRQYCDTYHLLENVARWEKPVVKGVAKKMDRNSLKSDFCTTKATAAFEELVQNLKCKYILLSYNNTGTKSNSRSNAKISDEKILEILQRKGTVKVFSKKHNAFTTGKSKNSDNEERLFLCIVHKPTELKQSPLNYIGGKYKLLPQMQPILPKNIETFIDLFCGGCNVGININAKHYIYNDVNIKLIGLYNTFYTLPIDETFSIINKIIEKYKLSLTSEYGYEFYNCNSNDGLSSYNKAKYNALKTDFNKTTEINEYYYLMLYVLIVYGFNHQIRFNKSGEYNLPVGKRDFNTKIQKKLTEFIIRIKSQNPKFTSLDFRSIDISKFEKNDFVYIDPPYLITNASYNENGGWTEKDELELLNFIDDLHKNNIRFALSNVIEHKGRINQLLVNWLKNNKNNYIIHHLDFKYSNSNYQIKDRNTKSKEVLITNYRGDDFEAIVEHKYHY